ncbi:metal-dependent hydrolase [Bacillaceae bacterium S4-13-58]
MDTGTHIVMGVALGGLATLDPAINQDPAYFNAAITGTIIASHAPDFDTILKLRNNATYIRNHRGITHSIPFVIFWGIFISTIIYQFVPSISFLHLWLWVFGAVIMHVFVDLFNAYGTQAARPFSKKWVAFGFINTFDPYIFILHFIGIIAWLLGADPGITFIIIYVVIALYYIKRYFDKREIIKKIYEVFPDSENIATSPTLYQNTWRIAITTRDHFYVARAEDGHIRILDEFLRKPLPNITIMRAALKDPNISAFLSFSPVYRWEIDEYNSLIEVRFIDLRYRSKGRYPFVAVVQMDENHQILSSYTGWIFSEEKLKQKLDPILE